MLVDRATRRVFLTIAEVAKRWAVTSQTVSQFHVKVGGLRADRVGGRGGPLLVALDDLTQYEQHRLLPDIEGKLKRLSRLKKRLSKPVEVPS